MHCIIIDRHVKELLTLVQTVDQSTTSHFRLWAAVVKSLSTPLQRRLGARICHLLFGRHIQPVEKRQTRTKVNIIMTGMTKNKRHWKRNTDGKSEAGKKQFGLEKLNPMSFLISMFVRSTSNCRAEHFKNKLQISVNKCTVKECT